MKKKGSLELSVNSIVILIIAIAVLGLIIGFIYNKFQNLDLDVPKEDPRAPTQGAEITTSPELLSFPAGKKAGIKIAVYNPTGVNTSVTPEIKCNWVDGTITNILKANPKTIPAYSYTIFTAVVETPRQPKDTYLCTAKGPEISVEQDIILEIK